MRQGVGLRALVAINTFRSRRPRQLTARRLHAVDLEACGVRRTDDAIE
jgi:hypothetical protein